MSNRINEPVERLSVCDTFAEASALAQKTSRRLGMPTAVRPTENGWEVLVPPGTSNEIHHLAEVEAAEAREADEVRENARRVRGNFLL